MSIEVSLQQTISEGLKSLFNIEIAPREIGFQQTKAEFAGDITFVVFPFTKQAGKKPLEIGELLGGYIMEKLPLVSSFNVVQGFLNLSISDSYWLELFTEIGAQPMFGNLPSNHNKFMVEYSSPNTNKPLHLGHLRNNFLGYSISQILKAAGNEVVMANLVNDRGIHICKSMVAYQLFGEGATPETANMKGDHLVGHYYVLYSNTFKDQVKELIESGLTQEEAEKQPPILLQAQELLRKWEQGDAETIALWKLMNSWVYAGFKQTYERIGVTFDQYYYESDTYLLGKDIIEEGLAKGVFFKKEDNSVWIDLTEDGLDQKLVLRGDGTSVYITQDIGTADLKAKDHAINNSIYVVGNEQDYHFKVLFLILQKLGRSYALGMYHLSYGMVELPSGKMKSREGTTVDADNLLDDMVSTARERMAEVQKGGNLAGEERETLLNMIGLGAIKYFLLKVEPKKKMLFNPAESIELQGNTATAIQYCHARVKSILRTATEQGIPYETLEVTTLHPVEKELIKLINQLPAKVAEAAKEFSPAVIANYCYDLTRAYNSLFAELSIFKADTDAEKHFRIRLSALTGRTLNFAMGLLGIEVPERM
jgi:arginyl-tRNA synthetase